VQFSNPDHTDYSVNCFPLLGPVLSRIEERLGKTRQITLFLEFDGTLTPLAPDPADTRLEPKVRETLAALAGRGGVNVTIMSRRSLEDLRKRVALDGVVYSGNHGLEIAGRHIKFVEPVAAARRQLLQSVSKELNRRLGSIPGTEVEFKELSLSVHYGQAATERVVAIEAAVRETVAATEPFLQMIAGNRLWDVVPRTGWHKGIATAWTYDRLTAGSGLLIYIGGDPSDEDAFRRFRGHITVHVGEPNGTSAHYFVPDHAAVHDFLRWLQAGRPALHQTAAT
jgi:trehalose-phosphatase